MEGVELVGRDLAIRFAAGGGHGFVHGRVVGQDEVLQAT